MKAPLHPTSRDRLLVFAPHPDDETIAAGELVQLAIGAGAAVRIVFATDGDNNPWPQRCIDRRWRIGAVQRARWGQRRRREALAALEILGVGPDAARFLGWPDQGLTECLMCDDTATAQLAAEIAAFAPSHVAMPALADRHPDHSALHVLLELALLRAGSTAMCLAYAVHGHAMPDAAIALAADPGRRERKHQAMLAHASQILLSRRRLLALASRPERFSTACVNEGALPFDGPVRLRIRHRAAWPLGRRRELLLVLATRNETLRRRAMLPRWPLRNGASTLLDTQGQPLPVEWRGNALHVALPAPASPLVRIYAKLDRVAPRVLIFDREPWQDAQDLLQGAAPVLGTTANGLV